MFDQIISQNTARTRRPLAVALSFTGQILLVALTVMLPLLHVQAIAPTRLFRILTAPQPRGEPRPVVPKRAGAEFRATPGPRVFDPVFRQPALVPDRILLAAEEPPAGMLTAAAGSAVYGVPDGVPGAVPIDLMPAPRVATPAPAQPTAPTERVRLKVGGNVQAAKITRQVTPVYPVLAKQARISGIVRLEAVIGRNGTIESLQVASGHPLLVQAALEAVRQWLYRPTLLNGEPVEVITQIEVNFKLGE